MIQKLTVSVLAIEATKEIAVSDSLSRYSSWSKLVMVVGRIKRLIKRREEEVSRIQILLVLLINGLLRVGSRLSKATLSQQ